MTKDIKLKKEARKAKDEIYGNRLIVTICAAFLGLVILMTYYRLFNRPQNDWAFVSYLFKYTAWISTGLLLLAAAFFLYVKVKRIDLKNNTFTEVNILAITAFTCFGAWVVNIYADRGIKVLYFLIPAYVILYVISSVFSKDFLYLCLYLIFAGAFSYFLNLRHIETALSNVGMAETAVLFFLSAIFLLLVLRVKAKGGRLVLGKSKIPIVKANTAYGVVVIPPIGLMAACILRFFFAQAFRFSFYFCIAYLVVAFLFYTFRLMKN